MIGPDPWEGVDLTPRARDPEPVRPVGARYLSDRSSFGLRQQADELGLEFIERPQQDHEDFLYYAWAAPAGGPTTDQDTAP